MIQEDFDHRFPNLLVAFLSWGLSKKKAEYFKLLFHFFCNLFSSFIHT